MIVVMDREETMDEHYLAGAIEALLFVTDEPLSSLAIAEVLEADVKSVEQTLEEIAAQWEEENRGIQLRAVAGGWRLFTHPRYHDIVEAYVLSWDTRKLSAAAMETLAIIAYGQPITRQGVASIRGVNSDSSIHSLVEKGLVRELGTADAPGNPMLYGTTLTFLEKFGLTSISDLTDIEQFAPDEQTRALISERLSATRDAIEISDEQARYLAEQMLYGTDESADAEDKDALVKDGVQKNSPDEDTEASALDQMFKSALAEAAGAVEKIDLDALEFDFDDE